MQDTLIQEAITALDQDLTPEGRATLLKNLIIALPDDDPRRGEFIKALAELDAEHGQWIESEFIYSVRHTYKLAQQHLMVLVEDDEKPDKKGFAAQIAAEVDAAQLPADLDKIHKTIQKRRMPMGKGKAWEALFLGWLRFDQQKALALADHVTLALLKAAYMQQPFSPAGWDILLESSKGKAGDLILYALDERLTLELSPATIVLAYENLRKPFALMSLSEREDRLLALKRFEKLATTFPDAQNLLAMLIKVALQTDATFTVPDVFEAVVQLLNLGKYLTILSADFFDEFVEKTPQKPNLQGILLAAKSIYLTLDLAEGYQTATTYRRGLPDNNLIMAYMTTTLVQFGRAQEAFDLVNSLAESDQKVAYARTVRALVCEDPNQARELLKDNLDELDDIAQFLLTPPEERLVLLKQHMARNHNELPAKLWEGALPDFCVNPGGYTLASLAESSPMLELPDYQAKDPWREIVLRHLYEGPYPRASFAKALQATLSELPDEERATLGAKMFKRFYGGVEANIGNLIHNGAFNILHDAGVAVLPFDQAAFSEMVAFMEHLFVEAGGYTYFAKGQQVTYKLPKTAIPLMGILGANHAATPENAMAAVYSVLQFESKQDEKLRKPNARLQGDDNAQRQTYMNLCLSIAAPRPSLDMSPPMTLSKRMQTYWEIAVAESLLLRLRTELMERLNDDLSSLEPAQVTSA